RGYQNSSPTSPSTPIACSPPTRRRSASTGPWTRSASPTPSPSSTATSANPPAWSESSLGSLPKGRPFPSATSGSTTSRPPNAMARTPPSWAWANPTASPPTEAPPSPISTTTSCAGPQQAHLLPRYRAVPAMIPKGTTDMRKSLAIPAAVAATTLTLAACGSSGNDSAEGAWPDEITMSLVPSIQGEDLAEALDPLTAYPSEGLGIEVNGVDANDYAATVEALGADQSQVIITDAGSLFNAMEQFNADLMLHDVRVGGTSLAAEAVDNNPDKCCEDWVLTAPYAASGHAFSHCTATEPGDRAGREGPPRVEALGKIDAGT